MTTIALDALGADLGPREAGVAATAVAAEGPRVRLVGPPDLLEEAAGAERVEVVEAHESISNREEPLPAVRGRPGASIVRACQEVAEGRADAVVSAGSTGATLAASTLSLKRIRGVHRPALCVQLPMPGRTVLLLDAGANVEVRPQHLVQFAYLGAVFAEVGLGIERPRVGLLSVGEEEGKGTPDVVAAGEELHGRGLPSIDFRGNVEGHDIALGDVDVVVTDGFTGNVALKAIEGVAKAIGGAISDAARSGPRSAAGGLLLRPALGGLRRDMDPNATGGALLLGLRSVAVVAHGSATSEGMANACRLAVRCVEGGVVERSDERLRDAGALRRPPGGRVAGEARSEAPASAPE